MTASASSCLELTCLRRNLVPHLVMIAGGTGLTPMYQIIRSSLQDPKDKTELALIYANVEEDDICGYLGDRKRQKRQRGREGESGPARDPATGSGHASRTALTRQ
jgi:hypothetical protein